MSVKTTIKNDYSQLKNRWKNLDPNLRFLDLMTIISILIFVVAFVLVSALDISTSVTNMAMMIFPILIGGYMHIFRRKIEAEPENFSAAKKEFVILSLVTLLLVLLTFVFSIIVTIKEGL